MTPKILIADTYYPDFINGLPFDENSTYETEVHKVLALGFGTADFYSRALTSLGWDCVDVLVNHDRLQTMWAQEHGAGGDILSAQLHHHNPDVVFLQDLSINLPCQPPIVAAQHSCPWAGDDKIRQCDIIFTSFPHYVTRIEALGVKAVYLPLAFERSILHMRNWKEHESLPRIHDCVFIGGVGTPSHWRYGMQVLNAVAEAIPMFKWWGYGAEWLPNGPLKQKYQGEAWGLDMYEILLQSKIVLNRHGEVAEGFANNLRMYEATGCGAMLLTDNETELFTRNEIVRYTSPADAVDMIRYFLKHETRTAIASRGQARTLKDHTYAQRMKVVSDTLMEMLGAGSLNEARNEA